MTKLLWHLEPSAKMSEPYKPSVSGLPYCEEPLESF